MMALFGWTTELMCSLYNKFKTAKIKIKKILIFLCMMALFGWTTELMCSLYNKF